MQYMKYKFLWAIAWRKYGIMHLGQIKIVTFVLIPKHWACKINNVLWYR